MNDLISRSALLKAMDERYKEKSKIVPDNLAEDFMQMEKLIKEQPTVCNVQQVDQINTYKDRLNEVWRFIGEMITWKDKKEADKFNEYMNISGGSELFFKYSPEEAIEKFQKWKEEKDIRIGDLVRVDGDLGIVTHKNAIGKYSILKENGTALSSCSEEDIEKIYGYNISNQLCEILKLMKEPFYREN